MLATLWLAPGVLLRNDYAVPSPPPFSFYIAIYQRPEMWSAITRNPVPAKAGIPKAEFRLTDYSQTGEVAHYELRTMPPAGYRWLAVKGQLRAEWIGIPKPKQVV